MTKKKRRRWGSVTPWRGKFRARAGDEARTSLGLFETVELADAALDEAYEFHQTQQKASGPGASLVGFGRVWLDRMEIHGERRGIDRERSRFEAHITTAPFASWPIESVTQRDVQRWIRDVGRKTAAGPRGDGKRKVSRQTVLNTLNLLRSILRAAIEDEIIDVSPAAGVVVPRERRTTEPWTWLSMSEIDQVLACEAISIRSRAAFAVGIFSGMRPGELWGLHWGDVLFDTGEIVVRHSRADATKGGRVRRVPLLTPAREWLLRWKREEHGMLEPKPTALVWPADGGGHHDDGYDAGWQGKRERARDKTGAPVTDEKGEPVYVERPGHRERAGITRPVRFYDLRHTCASQLVYGRHWVERGWIARPLRLEEVQHWLGHKSITTTERYAHFAPGGLLDVARPKILDA